MSLSSKIQGLREMLYFDNRWQLILSRSLFRATRLAVYKKQSCEFLVDQSAGDVNGIRTVLTSKMYSQFLPELVSLPNARLNVFDLGAHVGGFALLLHLHGFPIARLCCVEFNPATYLRMCFNVANNLPCEFVPIMGAICGERKQIAVWLGKGSTGDSIYSAGRDKGSADQCGSFTAEGWTFDVLYRRAFPNNEIIDICKMDIEGAEFEVFSSSSHEVLHRTAYLIMEIHSHKTHDALWVIDRLAECGFALVAQDPLENIYFFRNDVLLRSGRDRVPIN